MKLLKKIILIVFAIIVMGALFGHFYFDQKFTPEKNALTVRGSSSRIPIVWEDSMTALLLPITLKGIPEKFYMQLDLGSPTTLFYTVPLKSIQQKYGAKFNFSDSLSPIKLGFELGNMEVSSNRFKMLEYGDSIRWNDSDSPIIIGTLGTDLLEKRITVLDFKDNYCSFSESIPNEHKKHDWSDFEFKKRRILLPAEIENEKIKIVYDSGTSAFELITSKKSWEKYRDSGPILKGEGNSWGNKLTTYTAKANKKIRIGNTNITLSEVTYIEGTSFLQRMLMKSSGMEGMAGNKIFMGKILLLDCKKQKFTIY
ncbi:hypothetical protein D3C87_61970 [compost metagenome]